MRTRHLVLCWGIAGLIACSAPPPPAPAERPDPPDAPPVVVAPEELCEEDLPSERLGRLTPVQYLNAVSALLRAGMPQVPSLPPGAGAMPTLLEVEALAAAAEALVEGGGHLPYAPCAPAGPHDEVCIEGFIRNFGGRAFRRPVRDDELDTLRAVHRSMRDDQALEPRATFREALDAVAEVILQSPQLWYRMPVEPDDGAGDESGEGIRDADPWLRAERLAFLLTDAPPDDALTVAAASGALMDDAVLRAHAERLLETERGRERLGRFASEWLGLDEGHKQPALEALHKAEQVSPTLRPAMRQESERLYAHAVGAEQTFRELLTGTDAYLDQELAALYGVALPSGVNAGWVKLDPKERAGLITRAAFLTAHAGPEKPSPIRRGVHLYRHLLCQPMGDPPPNASTNEGEPDGDLPLTTRRIAEGKTSGPSCQGCHRLVNPPGFTLESYDALGRYRTHEWASTRNGDEVLAEIDTAATVAFADVRGFVQGPIELSRRLAESPTALDCHALTVFEKGIGRKANAADSCTLGSLQARFRETGELRTLWLDVATSAPVRKVRVSP